MIRAARTHERWYATMFDTELIERKLYVLRLWDERLQDIIAGRVASNVVRLQRIG
jgi:hypothetical protein